MLRLTPRQRTLLIEEIPNVANLVLAATFLGQFLGDRPFSAPLALIGAGLWLALAIAAFVLAAND